MRPDILLKTLHDRRRALIGWSMGVLGITAMCVSLWPTIEEQAADFQKLIDNYPDALHFRYPGDHDSSAGYLNTELFSFMAPLIFLGFAIGMATDTTAGEEERKTFDLLLSQPGHPHPGSAREVRCPSLRPRRDRFGVGGVAVARRPSGGHGHRRRRRSPPGSRRRPAHARGRVRGRSAPDRVPDG